MKDEWAKEAAGKITRSAIEAVDRRDYYQFSVALTDKIVEALLSAEKRGYARGVEAAAKQAKKIEARCWEENSAQMAEGANCVGHGIRALLTNDAWDKIETYEKLLPAPEGEK